MRRVLVLLDRYLLHVAHSCSDAGQYVNASRSGAQLHIGPLLRMYLKRIECDERGLAARLYPFIRDDARETQGTPVVIDPTMSFGQPVVFGTGIPVSSISERFKAGDSVSALALDYRLAPGLIEDALRAAA